jgi:hypothetical protein
MQNKGGDGCPDIVIDQERELIYGETRDIGEPRRMTYVQTVHP